MKIRKPKSKKLTSRKRNKIIKKVKQHNKKLSKSSTKKRFKSDDRIPNKFPFKLEMLKKLKEEHEKEKNINIESKLTSHTDLAQSAIHQFDEFEKMLNLNILQANGINFDKEEDILRQKKEIYKKDFIQVIDASDIIIHVLDTRDPLGTRSETVENEVLSRGANKSLILVLNKIDLVPKSVVIHWLKYLNKFYTTVAFKSCTDFKKFNIHKNRELSQCNSVTSPIVCIGAGTLLNTIKNIRNGNSITVGVVGLPNVGKSSVINSLARSNMSAVGCVPGITKSVKEIKLTNNITLLDSPGVVMQKKSDMNTPLSLSELLINLSDRDSYDAAYTIFISANHEQLKKILHLQPFTNFDQFITAVAKRYGKLKRGGVPDHNAASSLLVQHFTKGKIRFYYDPPEENQSASTEILSELKPRFIFDEASKELSKLDDLEKGFVALKIKKPNNYQSEDTEMKPVDKSQKSIIFSDNSQKSKLVLGSKPKRGILKKNKKYA